MTHYSDDMIGKKVIVVKPINGDKDTIGATGTIFEEHIIGNDDCSIAIKWDKPNKTLCRWRSNYSCNGKNDAGYVDLENVELYEE